MWDDPVAYKVRTDKAARKKLAQAMRSPRVLRYADIKPNGATQARGGSMPAGDVILGVMVVRVAQYVPGREWILGANCKQEWINMS